MAPILGYSSSHALGSRPGVLSYNINREWRMKQDTEVGYGSKQKRITSVEHGNHRQNRNLECLQTSLQSQTWYDGSSMICQLVDIEYCPGTPTVVQKVSLTWNHCRVSSCHLQFMHYIICRTFRHYSKCCLESWLLTWLLDAQL